MAYQKHKILNGQYVNIEQTPANIGLRIVAQIIDGIILGLYSTASSSIISMTGAFDNISEVILVILITIPFLYHPICELAMGGSAGKRMLKMRVVMQNGESVSFSSVFLRWIIQFIDQICLIGIIAMLCNKKNMRLGDMAAGTIVIKENAVSEMSISRLNAFTFMRPDYQPTYPFVTQLTWGQIDFINHTMNHVGDISYAPNQKKNILMLANKIAERFQVPDITPAVANRFLRTLVADYNYYTWTDND